MHFSLRCLVVTAAIWPIATCSNNLATFDDYAPTHVSRVTGRVVSPSGATLDSVEVGVNSNRPGYGYASNRARTNSKGEFSLEVRRLYAPFSVPQPDTVNAQVQVLSIRPRDVVNGQAPVASVGALLYFVAAGQTPTSTTVQVTLTR